ncbi:unnamed protein product [Schistosoma margrebowiei]|uniref:Xaa-Pro dipeptidase n=1 Tax=Schistosoma margrebowiei TaxID=48269 RepID=A0A183MEI3_9TREM|nr:unnamed protein product [Schistosoma margrebowiei]
MCLRLMTDEWLLRLGVVNQNDSNIICLLFKMASGAASRTAPIFQLGKCLAVPMQLHVANRQRLCNRIRNKICSLDTGKSLTHNLSGVFVVLQGGTDTFLGDSDAANVFRQESFFHWTFGVLEPDCYGTIEVATGRSTLFIPKIPEETTIYDGELASLEQFSKKYNVDETHYTDEYDKMGHINLVCKATVHAAASNTKLCSSDPINLGDSNNHILSLFTTSNCFIFELMECYAFANLRNQYLYILKIIGTRSFSVFQFLKICLERISQQCGVNTDSHRPTPEAKFYGIEKFQVNRNILHHEIVSCRVIKTEMELDVIRYTNRISSAAHRHLMRSVKPGMYQYQAESIFKHYCYFHGGMRHMSYTCIAATGCDCAILHYGHAGEPNEHQILDGEMCLFDMGGEYYCYSSDITCSFPVNGRFTDDQKFIYNAVLCASRAVLNEIKPGADWVQLHQLAELEILTHLREGGLLLGDINEMMKSRLGAIFMPHGLGHLLGCDVHDVGGYLNVRIYIFSFESS